MDVQMKRGVGPAACMHWHFHCNPQCTGGMAPTQLRPSSVVSNQGQDAVTRVAVRLLRSAVVVLAWQCYLLFYIRALRGRCILFTRRCSYSTCVFGGRYRYTS